MKYLIGIVFIFILAILIVNVYQWVNEERQYGYFTQERKLTLEEVNYIKSYRQTAISNTAALILSVITIMYVLFAKKMAEETKKMAQGTLEISALNDRLWRNQVMPLFYCIKPKLEFHPGTHYDIEFKNIGGLALVVDVAVPLLNYEKNYPLLDTGVDKKIHFVIPIQEQHYGSWMKSMIITITFHDKAACKYIQIFEYKFLDNKWIFVFNKSNLPTVVST